MRARSTALLGLACGLVIPELARRAALGLLRRDVARLNGGDHGPLLGRYAEDAVLRFLDGEHRWAGEHRGRAAIERFLRDFTAAGLQGERKEVWISGPPWALTLVARFDDAAEHGGEPLYANRIVMVVRTRFGRIVEQEDFYEDSSRIPAFDRALRERGIEPVGASPSRV